MRSTRIEKCNRRWFVTTRPAANEHNRSSPLSRIDAVERDDHGRED